MSTGVVNAERSLGLAWLRPIPTAWPVVRLKHLARLYAGGTPNRSNRDYWEDGTIPWLNSGEVNQWLITKPSEFITEAGFRNSSAKWIPKGALVMALAGQGKTKGMVAELAIESTCNQSMAAIVPTAGAYSRFLLYWLSANYESIRNRAGGEQRDGLNLEIIGEIPCPNPDPHVQRAIADYLDRETAQIAALIVAKERLLDLLTKKRLALVSRAVTRGLNPNVPLNDSDNPWLGKIPVHWSRCHLKRALASMDYGISSPIDSSGEIAVLRMGDIRDGEIDYSNVGFVDTVDDTLLLQPGDLVFNRTNSLDQIGKVAIFRGVPDYPVSFASYLVRLRCKPNVIPEYMNWLLNSAYPVAWGRAEALPAIGQANLNPNRYSYLPIALPPTAEQKEIVQHISGWTMRIDTVRTATERTIALLKKRRTALIAAAVTGQVDVGGAA